MRVYPKSHNGGDLIGVYLYAHDMSYEDMKKKASESDYYKTVFISHSDMADVKLDIFNFNQENSFCGNSIVGALSLMRDKNFIRNGLIFYEFAGKQWPAIIQEDAVYLEYDKPLFEDIIPNREIKTCFQPLIFHKKLKAQIINNHYRELILPVESLPVLDQLMPIDEKIIALSNKYNIRGIHAFAIDEETGMTYGRNFLPVAGIHEECITSTSNGALACYLHKHHKKQKDFIFKQGFSTQQNSEIHVILNIRENMINSVWAGGHAFMVENKIHKNFLTRKTT